MRFTVEQVASFTHGAVSVTCENDIFCFRRFTESQIDTFGSILEKYRTRSSATAGIRLEFETDSRTFCAIVKAAGKYEILVDDMRVLFNSFEVGDCLYVDLPEGNKHITVLLPWHTEGKLSLIRIDEGSYARPYDKFDRKFLFLGDSITQGSTSGQDSLAYVFRVAQWFNADYMNWGVGGTKFYPQTLEKPDFEPDTVFIAYGTNDFNAKPSIEVVEEDCKQYMDTVKSWYPNATFYCISPLWRLDGNMVRPAGTLDQVREVIIKQIEEHGFNHIDGYKLVPHNPIYFADKRLHPNAIGMSIYAEQLIKAITK